MTKNDMDLNTAARDALKRLDAKHEIEYAVAVALKALALKWGALAQDRG